MGHTNGHGRALRIAQISPLHESVPPHAYGGTERVVAYLTDALVDLGHDVTLFASGDSKTRAKLVSICPRALRLSGCSDPIAPHFEEVEEVYRRCDDFDVLHFHLDYLHFSVSRREQRLHVSTLHGRLDLPETVGVYRAYQEMPVVSISNDQRRPLPFMPWRGTVYHGLPRELYQLAPEDRGYLAFLGRISPEKRVDRAIEIAERAGHRLLIAAKIDRADRDYFEDKIRPLLRQKHVELVGEIREHEKQAFLGGARALLFPIDWPEPFGLVMIEAMACGTPVIAFRRGSVPEIIEHGRTGFICDDVPDAVRAVEGLGTLSRETCRREFEARFTALRMATSYVDIYRRLGDVRGEHTERGPLQHPSHELANG